MIYTKATMGDIAQLTELRIAYLAEDHGELAEKDLEIIKRDLPDYFMRNLNKNIFGYVARNDREIIACALLLVIEKPMSPAFINIVTVDVAAYAKKHFEKSVKKTLTIPAWLNTAALEQNINFSQVLQEALISKLHLQ